jgi:hypothetical protein
MCLHEIDTLAFVTRHQNASVASRVISDHNVPVLPQLAVVLFNLRNISYTNDK